MKWPQKLDIISPLELELQGIVSHLAWMLRAELVSSEEHRLYCWAVCLPAKILLVFVFFLFPEDFLCVELHQSSSDAYTLSTTSLVPLCTYSMIGLPHHWNPYSSQCRPLTATQWLVSPASQPFPFNDSFNKSSITLPLPTRDFLTPGIHNITITY